MIGLVVINLAYRLKESEAVSAGSKSCKLPSKWPTKKRHKKRPVPAIQYFLASDDFIKTDLLI